MSNRVFRDTILLLIDKHPSLSGTFGLVSLFGKIESISVTDYLTELKMENLIRIKSTFDNDTEATYALTELGKQYISSLDYSDLIKSLRGFENTKLIVELVCKIRSSNGIL